MPSFRILFQEVITPIYPVHKVYAAQQVKLAGVVEPLTSA